METEKECLSAQAVNEVKNESHSRLGLCEVCGVVSAKYTCPKCEVKTCSLKCNKIHKLELECNGQRDKTKFIPVNKFTNLDLSSDYRLLEEISRVVEVSKKTRGRSHKPFIPGFLKKIQEEARRRKIFLSILPITFLKRKKNTTKYNNKTKTLEWHVELIFVQADYLTISDNFSEVTKFTSILHKFLVKQEDTYLQDKLQIYQAVNIPGIEILLYAERKKGQQFYKIDPFMTLAEILRSKIIIEYPVFHIILKGHLNCYNVIDSDDESEGKFKSNDQIVNAIIKKHEADDDLDHSLQNLLFNSDCTDDENCPVSVIDH